MKFIGDIHGDLKAWYFLIQDCDESIQVGDFGAGFVPIPDTQDVSVEHKFIRGNHDSPHACRNSSRWIPDGTYDEKNKMFMVGGAYSIDWMCRKPGISWWEDEELSYAELYKMVDEYERLKPSIMVTHDCPTSVAKELFPYECSKNQIITRTGQAFEAMFSIHKPNLWVFGHWHQPKNINIFETTFICCSINQAVDVDLSHFV